LRAIAAVVKKMALRLHQDTALVSREQTYGEMIRERASGKSDGRLLAE
jgi:hypothetical protein